MGGRRRLEEEGMRHVDRLGIWVIIKWLLSSGSSSENLKAILYLIYFILASLLCNGFRLWRSLLNKYFTFDVKIPNCFQTSGS